MDAVERARLRLGVGPLDIALVERVDARAHARARAYAREDVLPLERIEQAGEVDEDDGHDVAVLHDWANARRRP